MTVMQNSDHLRPIVRRPHRRLAMTPSHEEGLPSIGSPATRALAEAGITTLEQVSQHRAADLLALHGVGPKAIAILRSALADRGETFPDDMPATAAGGRRSRVHRRRWIPRIAGSSIGSTTSS